ncbi:fatty-acid amide hydrolase 2-A-like isoform X3 [Parasteatoda tepidariorum]|uniref:fatty-acid amide hydrolase 2-A-like isoform X3 n=1 Tax=Parasteatoda tepidariorum TaxID=114398 RepID=UPI001C723795|nr:fatty-acid amide hydrolase 2-A-like isoform X1 [Parasteatoda tepidariorum]XP_042907644.1 fatty-acid amide hydrolase 2-A-like isoform X1 [Parasteatoda tepidariorum]XP_042907645.1 fatty-acid amide hydrolase 2-A-like isoform X1 [Parasteatoda tepidariorum]
MKVARIFGETLRILLFLTRPLSEYVLTYIYELFMGKTKQLPPIENEILLLSASELARKIRRREIRSEEIVRAFAERCRVVNPLINAIVDERYDDALNDARTVDKFLSSTDKSEEQIAKETPLLGVPFSCKEAIGVKGMTQTCGIVAAKGRVADVDSESAALYRKAGAIPLVVTIVPELCMWWESANLLHGVPRNPYNNTRTVGGSTGGEGAILTACGAVIGIGNDIAGSIRLPAAFCGIYGHKPSTGLVSNFGFFPSDDQENESVDAFVSTGPMCRYVEDLPLLMKILAKDDKMIHLNKEVDFRKVKVYFMEGFPDFLLNPVPAVRKAVKKAAKYFEDKYGITAVSLNIEELGDSMTLWQCKLLEAGCPPFPVILANGNGQVNMWLELIKSLFRKSDHTLPAIYYGLIEKCDKDDFYYECLKKYKTLEEKFSTIFNEDAILLIPTYPEPAPHYLMTIPKFANCGYTSIFSILGFPSTAIPAGMSFGVPISIQAISGRQKDHLTISAALELDKLFGGWKSSCHT